MSKGFASNYRTAVLAIGVLVAFAGIATRLVFLHVLDREELVRYVDKARRDVIVENAKRGDILDSHGDILATSRPLIVLGVDPQILRREDEPKWPQLAKLIDMPLPELEKIFQTKTREKAAPTVSANESATAPTTPSASEDDADETEIRWAKLSESVSESTYDAINALNIRGVYGTRVFRRVYPHNQLAAHVIGFVNKSGVPASGIEHFADFYLRGQYGWRETEKDGRQHELAQFRSRDVPSTDGYNVVLSIDSFIQHIVEGELENIMATMKPQKATIIVSDAKTGFILALGNAPTFDLNDYNKAPLDVQTDPAVALRLDPGSTFKIVAVSGALNEKLVTLDTRFDTLADTVDYNGRHLRLLKDDHHVDHPMSVAEIVSLSSNRGATRLAMLLGDQRFYNYARAFGFGERTGFPFGGEVPGLLNAPENWSGIDITRIPAGYSISATPMQIHYAMATIASGGQLFRPQIISEVRDSDAKLVYRFGPSIRRRVISQEVAEQVAIALRGVVTDGTGKNAMIPGYQVAGKTGTAQKLIDGHYSAKNHICSFVGFFPASRPRVVMSIIVDDGNPPNGVPAAGAVVSAPSFKRIGEQLIQYLNIDPVEPVEAAAVPHKTVLAMGGMHR